MVIVLYEESPSQPTSVNSQENARIAEVARLYGCRPYVIPSSFEEGETADDVLMYMPHFDRSVAGVWVGFIPSSDRYKEVYEAAARKNVFLLNDPIQHRTAQEFDRYYPLLGELTPRSASITSVEECANAARELGFPLFVRGAVKSNKDKGWQACVAQSLEQLAELVQEVLKVSSRARGRVIVRQLVSLRHKSLMPGDFPRGREYRVFIHNQEVLAMGYYWDEFEDEFALTEADARAIYSIALEAAKRVGVPFIAADVGQLESGEWIIIEVGDAQFAGLSRVPILELWSKLAVIQ